MGELGRSHSPSLVKYPVLNFFILLSFFLLKFVSFFFCNLASPYSIFRGVVYPPFPQNACLPHISISNFHCFIHVVHVANQQ